MGQGCARDIMMTGLLRLPKEILPMLRVLVHDEIVLSVPVDAVEDVRRTVIDALSFEWHGVQVLAGSSEPGVNWADSYAVHPAGMAA
jgi:DNA polymerase-1